MKKKIFFVVLKLCFCFIFFFCFNTVIATAPKDIRLKIQPSDTGFSLLRIPTLESILKKSLPTTPQIVICTIAKYTNYNIPYNKCEVSTLSISIFIYLINKMKEHAKKTHNEKRGNKNTLLYLKLHLLEQTLYNNPATHQLYKKYKRLQNMKNPYILQKNKIFTQFVYTFQTTLGMPLFYRDEVKKLVKNNMLLSIDDNVINNLSFIELMREISPFQEQKNNWINLTYLQKKLYYYLDQHIAKTLEKLRCKPYLKTIMGKYYACLLLLKKINNNFILFPPHTHIMGYIIVKLSWKKLNITNAVEKASQNFLKYNHLYCSCCSRQSSCSYNTITKLLTTPNACCSKHILSLIESVKTPLETTCVEISPESAKLWETFIASKDIHLRFSVYNLLEFIHKGFVDKKKDQENMDFLLDIIMIDMLFALNSTPKDQIEAKDIQIKTIIAILKQLLKKNSTILDTTQQISNSITNIYQRKIYSLHPCHVKDFTPNIGYMTITNSQPIRRNNNAVLLTI